MNPDIHYELRLMTTAASTGYFGCVPAEDCDLATGLAKLKQRPFDAFLRRHLLSMALALADEPRRHFLQALMDAGDAVSASFVHEVAVLGEEQGTRANWIPPHTLAAATALIYLRSVLLPDQRLHHQWVSLFKRNLREHRPLPAPRAVGLAYPGGRPAPSATDGKAAPPELAALFRRAMSKKPPEDMGAPERIAAEALEKLIDLDVLEGPENRHLASLSPIALLRRWRLKRTVSSGRNRYRLTGIQTSYGKGLSLDAARASCLMEIVERTSAFVSVDGDRLPDTRADHRLVHGAYRDLCREGFTALDPNRLALEVPYQGEPLFWIQGHDPMGYAVWVPAQAVLMFCNLDEVGLFSGLGSTGLASGSTLQGARVSALLEVLERDADSVMPFDPGSCFELDSDNPYLAPLFAAYRASGIAVRFETITTEFTVPCYRAFVVSADGSVISGTGAHLDARKAVIAALTETAYPFPATRATLPAEKGLEKVKFETLPNCDTNSSEANLAILETILAERGFGPVYVDLTHKDLALPVVRAIVPGLEVTADFDRFSRVPARLLANYEKGRGVF